MLARIAVLAVTATGLAACAIVNSSLIEDASWSGCASDAGSYYLPKTHLMVEVQATAHDSNVWHTIDVKQKRLPDRERGYCLDYLARANADDSVTVRKYKSAPILGLVSSDSTDRSIEIAETLVRALFTAISGNPDYFYDSAVQRSFVAGTDVTVFTGDYDPFDPEHSAVINEALSDFGFCLIVEHYTFDLSAASIDAYCDDPRKTHTRTPARRYTYADVSRNPDHPPDVDPTSAVEGLYYRPRIAYQAYIFGKDNLQTRGNWSLRATYPVEMENIAPILSVGLDRTAFTQRKTTLVFDEGVLKEACHFKQSELVEAVQLPLVVVKSVVALPANILQVRIDQTAQLKQLVEAQDNAIKRQAKYLADLNDLSEQAASLDPRPPQSRPAAQKGSQFKARKVTKKTDDQLNTATDGHWNASCQATRPNTLDADLESPVQASDT